MEHVGIGGHIDLDYKAQGNNGISLGILYRPVTKKLPYIVDDWTMYLCCMYEWNVGLTSSSVRPDRSLPSGA